MQLEIQSIRRVAVTTMPDALSETLPMPTKAKGDFMFNDTPEQRVTQELCAICSDSLSDSLTVHQIMTDDGLIINICDTCYRWRQHQVNVIHFPSKKQSLCVKGGQNDEPFAA